MKFESESQLSVRCFKCGCFGHRGLQCENYLDDRRSQNSSAGGMLEKCWICGCLGHIAVECKEKTVTCFSCGQRGHKQEDCTSPMANCWNCGERGHIKKDCPVKKNVGMCFYCHKVGHHSKDCNQKMCYICESKDHLWTRCPLRGARGFQPRINGYMRRLRHFQQGQDHQQTFRQGHFSKQLLFNAQYWQSFGQDQQFPGCIRPKSVPLSSEQKSAIAQDRPMPLRRTSDPAGFSTFFGSSLEHSQVPQSIVDYEMIRNQSCSPNVGSAGLSLRSDHDGSGFSMPDVFSRSDESIMKVTQSENDSVVPSVDSRQRRLIQSVLADWKKDISTKPDDGLPTWGSSEIWWNNGLRAEVNNSQDRSQSSTQREELKVPGEYDSVDRSWNKDGKDFGENTIVDGGDEQKQTIPVQTQHILKVNQESETKSLDVLDVRDEAVAQTKVGTIPKVINTSNSSPTNSSISTKDIDTHILVSEMSCGKQKDGKSQTVEEFVQEATASIFNSDFSNAKFLKETHGNGVAKFLEETNGNGVHKELKRVREQLAEAKIKLDEKEEQLDKTQKMVEALKRVIFLDSSVNKDCPKRHEQSTKGEDVSNRCPSCIQILKNLESCEKCMM